MGFPTQEYWGGLPFPPLGDLPNPRIKTTSDLAGGFFTTEPLQFSSVTQSCLTLWDPHGLQHARPPCLSPTPEFIQTHVHWIGDAIYLSHPFLFPSPPAFSLSQHEFFPVSQFFVSGGQSIGASVSISVLPMNIQDWFPLGWTGWIPLQSKGLSRVFSNTTVQKHQFFGTLLSFFLSFFFFWFFFHLLLLVGD